MTRTEEVTSSATSTLYPPLFGYGINLQLRNLRTYQVKVEYKQQINPVNYYYYTRNVALTYSTGNTCVADGSKVKCKFALGANVTDVYSYRFQ